MDNSPWYIFGYKTMYILQGIYLDSKPSWITNQGIFLDKNNGYLGRYVFGYQTIMDNPAWYIFGYKTMYI